MKIAYFGSMSPSSTSCHRANALVRLGHDLVCFDPKSASQPLPLFASAAEALHFRTGYFLKRGAIERWLKNSLSQTANIDLCWVDSGEYFSPNAIGIIKAFTGAKVVLYNHDDPTGSRDGLRFATLRRALKTYDLCVTVRNETADEMQAMGAQKILKVWRSYDEVAHKPLAEPLPEAEKYRADVAFVGTWMRGEQRDDFLLGLHRRGLDVAIWGDRWERSRHWSSLRHLYRGAALYGADYVAALSNAKLTLGLLSKGNRDQHTTRSVEIPYAGGLFCGERTNEHAELFTDGVDAVLWSDLDDCHEKCVEVLKQDSLREQIRVNGMVRIRALGVGHEDICREVLSCLADDSCFSGRAQLDLRHLSS